MAVAHKLRWLGRKAVRTLLSLLVFAAILLVLMQVVGTLRAPHLPDRAPDFALMDLQQHPVQLADFRGQRVLLNFWASWCLPCRLEIPVLERWARAHPDVAVLGISGDRHAAEAAQAVRDLGIAYRVVMGDPAMLQAYGITTFPTTVLVGPHGEVIRAFTGILTDPQLWWLTR